jgi:dTDP-4-amino-4,6-dideoxygalactose transaminase
MIPIAKPYLGEEEVRAATDVIFSGWVSQGPRVEQFEKDFASYAGSKYACAVSSCTTALHLALLTVGVEPGDVVLTVSHTFIATANSIRHCYAEPAFVDIDLESYNMSPDCLKKCLQEECEFRNGRLFLKDVSKLAAGDSPLAYFLRHNGRPPNNFGRIAAIIIVHQMGMPCDLNSILPLAQRFNIPVIEDAACAIGSEISMDAGKSWDKIGKPHADIACFSFHPRKVITTGEGGMLTTNNQEYDRKFRLLRHHGMSISDRERHDLKKVVFEEYSVAGYNYRMTDIQAAIGIEQLKRLPCIIEKRRKIACIYREQLKGISWLRLPSEPSYCRTNWQSYPVRMLENAPVTRDELMQLLFDADVSTRRGIMNAHQEKPYALSSQISLKNSELARDSVVLMPIYHELDEGQIDHIAKVIKEIPA